MLLLLRLRLDRPGVDKCRKEKRCSPEKPISPTAMCPSCFDSEPRSRCSPKATRSWHWQTQNADRTCLARDADWEVLQASRIEQVFQPGVRLEKCKRTDDPTLSAWKAVYSTWTSSDADEQSRQRRGVTGDPPEGRSKARLRLAWPSRSRPRTPLILRVLSRTYCRERAPVDA